MDYKMLSSLNLPNDISSLTIGEKNELCSELRNKIIETVSKNGGHLSSNLGTVELTLAIHSVFDSPNDKVVFDVGHQAYAHKLLTGRFKKFDTLRQKGGISGFTRPQESEHDPCVSGHSSNSISIALGIAEANKLSGNDNYTIAVIGDGALTGGLSYEGLNNAGSSNTKLIVVLNYNEMSISKNVGGIAKYLSELRLRDSYKKTKYRTKKILEAIPFVGKWLRKIISFLKNGLKQRLLHCTMFEDLGFKYIGPIDGHNIEKLEQAFEAAKKMNTPVLVQVNTVKGKGYEPSEKMPGEYHGVSSFDIESGEKPSAFETFADCFGKELSRLALEDERIIACTAAMKYGTGLKYFNAELRHRLFDVGIAEEHAVCFCSGLASSGYIPVFSVYSSFLQRCYDEILHDVAIANRHVIFAVGNSGLVGEDGETHQGLYDVSFISSIPNTKIYSPSTFEELKLCLNKAIYEDNGAVFIRFPKGADSLIDDIPSVTDYHLINNGTETLVISYGKEVKEVLNACKEETFDILKIVNVWPISVEIFEIINNYRNVFVFEEATTNGSLGEKLKSRRSDIHSYSVNGFVPSMKTREALSLYNLSAEKIIEELRKNK